MSSKAKASKSEKIDQLMEQASAALAKTEYFECERLALEALNTAFEAGDFERMARIVLPLQEARRQKRLEALECSTVIRLNEADQELLQEDEQVEAGCYLFEPLLVGADGRDLRERANQQGVPVLVVVREPRTSVGEWPIVMIGPQTVRTKVRPPGAKTRMRSPSSGCRTRARRSATPRSCASTQAGTLRTRSVSCSTSSGPVPSTRNCTRRSRQPVAPR
ncbi:MAG: hypothetical protein ACFHWZ_04155 [Phycisphaerales bacterium]